MITDTDVEIVAGRLGAWSGVLGDLANPDACRRLLTILDEADGKGFHELIDEWPLPGEFGCIDIVETITRFVQTGDYEDVEKCSIVTWLRPPNPSTTTGKGYRLDDGTVLWLTDAEWWQMMDRAISDQAWRDANHSLLVTLGILFCVVERIPVVQRFDLDKRYSICPPGGDPRARRRLLRD
jgi:hypothetical protein